MRTKKRGALALGQIFLLVIGIVAISYSIGIVGAGAENSLSNTPGPTGLGSNIEQTSSSTYIVVAGDTFNEIAKKNGLTPDELAKLNKQIINKDVINVGDKIILKPTDTSKYDFEYPDKLPLIGTKVGPFLGHLVEGAVWAVSIKGGISLLGSFLVDDSEQLDLIGNSAMVGIIVGKAVTGGVQQWTDWGGKAIEGDSWYSYAFGKEGLEMNQGQLAGAAIGAIAAWLYYTSSYEETKVEKVEFTCNLWNAPQGGQNCEKCNNQGLLPCSEYQCRSLGQACQLINKGTTEETCTWVNRHDTEFPTITPWDGALLEDYSYSPDNTISPPDRGVRIINDDSTEGCAQAFTPLSFGFTTNEPAQCKIDLLRKSAMEDMNWYVGGDNLFTYNHSHVISLPGPSSSENITLQNDGNFELFVRCADPNGNSNTANFVFKYCVEKGPDTTPPLIVSTNMLNNMPIAFNKSSVDLEVYVNEPAECKWSHLDQSYEDMEGSMTCATSVMEMNVQMLYKCSTTLTGLKNEVANDFYFRCKDQPFAIEDRNINKESYKFTLMGTKPLTIKYAKPNQTTVKGASTSVNVTLEMETNAGYKEGEAICYYSESGDEHSYVAFFNTNSHLHTQEFYFPEGNFIYYLKCVDLGGNEDRTVINFQVDSDSSAPMVVRAFHEESYLKLITDEPAECVYDVTDCTYNPAEGTSMTSIGDTNHFADWNPNVNYYIKCEDNYGNKPLPNVCSIIVKSFGV